MLAGSSGWSILKFLGARGDSAGHHDVTGCRYHLGPLEKRLVAGNRVLRTDGESVDVAATAAHLDEQGTVRGEAFKSAA